MILKHIKEKEYWDKYLEHLESKEEFRDELVIENVKIVIKQDPSTIEIEDIPLITKKDVRKYKTDKKRTVFLFPEPYNTYLKMINWLLMNNEEYSNKFYKESYAYQRGKNVNTGVKKISAIVSSDKYKYFVKTDFKDYFNTINVDILEETMSEFFEDTNIELQKLIMRLLRSPISFNKEIFEGGNNGTMAGTPLSGYLANVYMNKVDHMLGKENSYYVRYADDLLFLTNVPSETKEKLESLILPYDIKLNQGKTKTGIVKEGVSVLGFYFKDYIIDIDVSKVNKMKSRIKRRSIWFKKWERNNKVKNRVMVRTFVKGMNQKLYSRDDEDRMNWSRWYFSSVNTDESLKEIDRYLVQYIRYLISGKQLGYRKHSLVSYEEVKKTGFKPLVAEYWNYRKRGTNNE